MFMLKQAIKALTSPRWVKEENQTAYMVLVIAGVCAFSIHFSLIFVFLAFDLTALSLLNIVSTVVWAWAIAENYAGNHSKATYIAAAEILIHSSVCTLTLDLSFGFQVYLWPLAALLTFHQWLNYKVGSFIGLCCILIYALLQLFTVEGTQTNPLYAYADTIYLINVMLAGIPLVLSILAIRIFIERQQHSLNDLATKDELTGLYNRRYFNSFLKHYSEKAKRDSESYCLVMIDVDHFKSINDKYGHEIGDLVLKKVACFLKQQIRSSDVVCRWGGEEFLILLPNCQRRSAYRLIDDIRDGISHNLTIEDDDHFIVTISAGIASSHEAGNIDDLINHSDKLMYKAKMFGRNCVITNNLSDRVQPVQSA
jgi:diguanylate cyclase (GGDEF)-like protein